MKWYVQTVLNILKAHAKDHLEQADSHEHIPTAEELESVIQWVECGFGYIENDAIYYMLVYLDRWLTNVKAANADQAPWSSMKLIDAFKHSLVLAVKMTNEAVNSHISLFLDEQRKKAFKDVAKNIINARDEKLALKELSIIINGIIESVIEYKEDGYREDYYRQKKSAYMKLKDKYISEREEDTKYEKELFDIQIDYIEKYKIVHPEVADRLKDARSTVKKKDELINKLSKDLEYLEDLYKNSNDINYIKSILDIINEKRELCSQTIKHYENLIDRLRDEEQNADSIKKFGKREIKFCKTLQREFVEVEDVLKVLDKYAEKIDNELETYFYYYFIDGQEFYETVEYTRWFLKEIQNLIKDFESRKEIGAIETVETYEGIMKKLNVTTPPSTKRVEIAEEKVYYQSPIADKEKSDLTFSEEENYIKSKICCNLM